MSINKLFYLFVIVMLSSSILSADIKNSDNGLDKVSLQLQWIDQFQFAGYYIAKKKGFYKDVGLDVEIKKYKANILSVDEVVNKRATYGVGRSSLIIDKSNGAKIKLLASIFQSSPLVLLATKESGIKTVKDFIGKRVMVTNDASLTVSMVAMINNQGIKQSDIIKLPQSFNINDLIDNKTDLIASYISNEPFYLNQKGVGYRTFDPKEYGFDFYSDILFTTDYEVKNNPKRVKAFTNATLKGWRYAFANIEETVDLILKKYNSLNKSRNALIYEAYKLKELAYYKSNKIGKIDIHKIQRIFDIYSVMGFIKNIDLDIDKFIVNNSKYNGYKKDIFFTKAEKEWIKNNTIEVATTSSWSPFNFLNKDDELVGIGMDYWELISKKAGLKSNINEIKNFTEVLDGIKNKKYDINIATSRTEDKAKYGLFSDTYEKFPISIAAKATENFIAKPEILSGKKVAVGKDYSSYHLLKKRFPNIDFILVKNTKEALEFVSKGFAYACVDVEPALHYQIVKNNFDDIKIIGSTSVDFDVQVMIRDDYQQLQIILNKAIGMITKEEMVSIYKRWMTIHSKEKFDYKLLVQLFSVGLVIFIILLYRQKLLKKYNMKLEKSINKATKDLKKQNFKLQESVDNFQNLFDTTMEMIVLFKMDGEIIEINKPGVVLSGYKNKKDLIGRNISEFILDTDMEKVKKSMQNDMPEPYELEMINKDGSKVNTLISGRNIIRDSKKIRIATIIDLTEMKEKDRTIQEQSKLVLMGEMISMIAHQWRQPLNILGTINMKIETKLEFGEIMTAQTYEPISDSINKQLQYLSKTIDDFRDFFKPDKEKKYTTLKELVNSSLSIVGASISSKQIEIIKEFNCENEINTYTSEVTQVILNIIKNAEDILLEKEIKDPFIKIVTYKKDAKNRSVLEISDNGGGIQKDIMDKIFEPYFSTKLEKHGTGLGLYMSKIIIEEHCGGKLTVKNRDKGVVFKISL